MEHADLLVFPQWLIPVEPADTVLTDHALAVRDGVIIDLLPAAEARARYAAASVQELPGQALIPGLVNAHTHAAMTLLRGLADDLPLMTWLAEHIWPAEQRHVSAEFVQHGAELGIAEMIRGGTTCFSDMYFFPEITARAASRAGMRIVAGMIVIDFPSAWASGPKEYLAKGLDLHDAWRNDPLVSTLFAPHAPYTVADAVLERVRVLADELDVPVHIHLHETAGEVQQAVAEHGERPFERLRRLGLISPNLIAVHMTQLQDEEITCLADAGAHVVHCPESNLKLASGFCPVAKLRAAGVNVALGTDGAASNNDLDMLGEMHTAALLGKAVANDAAALPAAEVLRMATLSGARALRLEERIGSLEVGKDADLVAVDLGGPESAPVYSPVSQIVYSASRQQVRHVWVAGRHLMNDRALTTVDVTAVTRQAAAWRDRISAS